MASCAQIKIGYIKMTWAELICQMKHNGELISFIGAALVFISWVISNYFKSKLDSLRIIYDNLLFHYSLFSSFDRASEQLSNISECISSIKIALIAMQISMPDQKKNDFFSKRKEMFLLQLSSDLSLNNLIDSMHRECSTLYSYTPDKIKGSKQCRELRSLIIELLQLSLRIEDLSGYDKKQKILNCRDNNELNEFLENYNREKEKHRGDVVNILSITIEKKYKIDSEIKNLILKSREDLLIEHRFTNVMSSRFYLIGGFLVLIGTIFGKLIK